MKGWQMMQYRKPYSLTMNCNQMLLQANAMAVRMKQEKVETYTSYTSVPRKLLHCIIFHRIAAMSFSTSNIVY